MPKRYKIQLYGTDRKIIQTSGGVCKVCTAGDAVEQLVTNKAGSSLTNPVVLSSGEIEFYVADDTVQSVDLYIMAPGGQFVVRRTVKPGETGEIYLDTEQPNQVAVIPMSADDAGYTAATEIDTGFDMPDEATILPQGVGMDVSTVDAGESIDVGLLSTEGGGDADGFLAVLLTSVAGVTLASLLAATQTLGALLRVDESAGDLVPESHRIDGTAVSVSYTATAGSDTVEGFIKIPYLINL